MTSKLTPQERAYDVCEKVGGYFYNHEQWEHLDALGSMRELLESTIAAAVVAERDAALEAAAVVLKTAVTRFPDGIAASEKEEATVAKCIALVRGMKGKP